MTQVADRLYRGGHERSRIDDVASGDVGSGDRCVVGRRADEQCRCHHRWCRRFRLDIGREQDRSRPRLPNSLADGRVGNVCGSRSAFCDVVRGGSVERQGGCAGQRQARANARPIRAPGGEAGSGPLRHEAAQRRTARRAVDEEFTISGDEGERRCVLAHNEVVCQRLHAKPRSDCSPDGSGAGDIAHHAHWRSVAVGHPGWCRRGSLVPSGCSRPHESRMGRCDRQLCAFARREANRHCRAGDSRRSMRPGTQGSARHRDSVVRASGTRRFERFHVGLTAQQQRDRRHHGGVGGRACRVRHRSVGSVGRHEQLWRGHRVQRLFRRCYVGTACDPGTCRV